MAKAREIPAALTIAGSDSGGGAGIQADLKTFAALGVHGLSAITCVTAQNPESVRGIERCSPKIVRRQLEAVFEQFPAAAVKTGMLYSVEIIREVARCLKGNPRPLVVDPVMVATSGTRLLAVSAVKTVQSHLLTLATLVTPNLDEAAALAGGKIRSVEGMRSSAKKIQARFGCAALVKGGHLRGGREAVDIFFDGQTELLLSAPFVRGIRTHGTGCTYSAAIAAYLALGRKLPRAVELAKRYVTGAIARCVMANGHSLLNHFWRDEE
jgi:hydroxymethylpyrimidine/phosphomethylpyrimidine kinase